MTPIQQLMLGVGASKKTYLDDVFSTYLYTGNSSSSQTFNNGVDLSGKGGMVWIKNRGSTYGHQLFDTVRGVNKRLRGDLSNAEDTQANTLTAFNSNGFTIGTNGEVSDGNTKHASWSFRKAPGFFDIVTYTGTGSTLNISHNLGCVPGLIIIKCTSAVKSWVVYHRQVNGGVNPEQYAMFLNSDGGENQNIGYWNNTAPTATQFTLGDSAANENGETHVAYLFAGGESTAATARSVDFDGSSDSLVIYNQADLSPEDGDFTCEMWIKPTTWATGDSLVYASSSGFSITRDGSNNALKVGMAGSTTHLTSTSLPEVGQWTHVAVARSGTTMRLFFNGVLNKTETVSHSYASPVTMYIVGGGGEFNGKISNFRFVKGTAVYTSSFRPPYEPLANITNTKLLCCNNSSITGSTVTPGTVTSGGDPTASTDSPFDDPAGFVFGEAGDQNVIKCGSITRDSTIGEINVGFEPQWVLIKRTDASSDWFIIDSMRGTPSGAYSSANGRYLKANLNSAESTNMSSNGFQLTATGFKNSDVGDQPFAMGNNFIYMAIRRPDVYVGKPAEAGTDVFNMVMGTSNSDIPAFVSGFVTDFATTKYVTTSQSWYTSARLTQGKYLFTDTSGAETSDVNQQYDFNNGYYDGTSDMSDYQAWMWKRGAGFDVVAFQGTATNPGPSYRHNLGKVPELKIIKRRNASTDWLVTGTAVSQSVGGNNNSKDYYMKLNENDAATTFSNYWDGGNDTSTHFTVRHGNGTAGGSADPYLCLLFASVDGISKVGSYTGNGSTGQTIQTGFQPRFVIIKRVDIANDWYVIDTTRGWSSGDDKYLYINGNAAQGDYEFGAPASNGFTLVDGGVPNTDNAKFIYYAHA